MAQRRKRWLMANIRSYLTGFLEGENQAKTSKKSQKCSENEWVEPAFTIAALTMAAPYAIRTVC
jgi:predicted benzoate:H+ symporter BenE